MAQGVVARCYDLQDAAGLVCGKSYRWSGLSEVSGVKISAKKLNGMSKFSTLQDFAMTKIDEKQNDLSDGLDQPSTGNFKAAADLDDTAKGTLTASSQQAENEVAERKIIRAAASELTYAELEVDCSFSQDGQLFSCNAVRYRAGSNGRTSGNLYLRFFTSFGAFPKTELTNDNGKQDGVWRPISGGSTINCIATDAKVELEYIYDIGGAPDRTLNGNIAFPYVPAAPLVTPKSVTNEPVFDITGTGAITVTGAQLSVFDINNVYLARGTIFNDGTWKASVRIPENSNSLTLYANQTISGKTSAKSNSVTVSRALFATIASPTEGATVRIENLVFTGTTNPGANIVVVRNDDHYKNLTESKVEPSGNWNRPLLSTVMLLSGPLKVEAQYSLGSHGYSPVRTVNIQSYPILSAPSAGSEQEQTFTVSGTGGRPGATLYIQKDQDASTVYGSTSVSANSWSVQATLPPGRHTVTPEQVMGGVRSTPGVPRTFIIKPAPVTGLAHAVDGNSTLTVSGSGYAGATVDIHLTDNGTPIASVPVPVSTWSASFHDWLPETGVNLDIRQRVADGVSGWVCSGWAPRLTFDVPVPKPTLKVEVSPQGIPRFFGTGKRWPNQEAPDIEVRISGGVTPIVPVVKVATDGTWSSSATQPWQPDTYSVVAKQGFRGAWSLWSDHVTVTIEPPAPTIDPIEEVGLSPVLSGTCEAGAVVSLKFSDSATLYNATVTAKTWRFQRPQPFTEGVVYTVEAVQTVNGQPSKPAVKEFVVYLERLKPTILSPAQGEECDSDLTVTGGEGMKDASMQLWDARDEKPLGDPVVLNESGDWSIHLRNLKIDDWFITARQTLRGRPSEHSDIREFKVVVMPPEFLSPQPGSDLPRTSFLRGKGRPNGRVTVWCKGIAEPLLRDVLIGPSGVWEGSVTQEVGEYVFWATQTFEGKTSKPSLEVPCRFVPHAVLAESPTPEERLGKTVTVSGFGFPGDRITLKRGNAALGEAPVLPDRTWSITATLAPPDGAVTLSLVASSGDFHSAPSEWVSQLGLYMPEFTKPVAGQWGSPAMTFAGLGKPGSGTLMTWYNPDVVLAAPVAVTQTGWTTGSTQPLTPGGHWCRFWQSFSTGTPISDCSESGRFDVRIDSSDK